MNGESDIPGLTILQLGDMALVGYRLARLLRKYGFATDYLSYANAGIRSEDQSWAHAFNTTPSDRTHKLRVALESLVASRKYDVVHAHSIFAIPLMLQKPPFVFHLHGTDVRVYAEQRSPRGLAIRRLIRTAPIVLVSTPDLVQRVAALGRQARFLPNPIDFDAFRHYDSPVHLHDGFDFVIFHPSRHSPVKRNDILIRALRRTVDDGYDVRAVMVDSDIFVQDSKKLVAKLLLEDRVVWLPFIPGFDMADYYNASDIVCDQFHIDDALCLVTLEAMACGKPVVTKFSHIGIGANGYTTEPPLPVVTNEEDVTERIETLLESPSNRRTVGERGALWVRDEHTPEKIVKVLQKCYRTAGGEVGP